MLKQLVKLVLQILRQDTWFGAQGCDRCDSMTIGAALIEGGCLITGSLICTRSLRKSAESIGASIEQSAATVGQSLGDAAAYKPLSMDILVTAHARPDPPGFRVEFEESRQDAS